MFFFQDSASTEWTLRHGRSTALFVGLKLCPGRLYTTDSAPRFEKVLLGLLQADRVPVAENGVRCACFLFDHCRRAALPVPAALVAPYCRAMNHQSNDVKWLVAVTAARLGSEAAASENAAASPPLPSELLKALLPMLVNGTKEKNSAVKASSESALVSLLQMRGKGGGKDAQAKCLAMLDSGARDALQVRPKFVL